MNLPNLMLNCKPNLNNPTNLFFLLMNEDKIRQLFKKNHKKLVWIARGYVGEMYADDLVSDSFLKLLEVDMVDENKAEAFLNKVVKNNCLRFLISKKYGNRERERVSENDYPYKPIIPKDATMFAETYSNDYADSLVIRTELINLIAKKREALPERRKDIFDLLYLHDLNYEEISAALGVSNFVVRKEKMILSKMFSIFGKERWYKYLDRGHPVFKLKTA